MSTKTNTSLPPQYQQSPEQKNALNAETSLMNTQTGILGQEQSYSRATMPFMFSAMGLNPQFDSSGNITSMGQMPAWMGQQQNIQGGLQDRVQNALNGGLATDPYLKQHLDMQNQSNLQQEYNTYGTNPYGSTGGMQADSMRQQTYNNTMEESRRGDLTMAEALAQQNQGGMMNSLGMIVAPGAQNYNTMASSATPGNTMSTIYGQGVQQQQMGMQYGFGRNQVLNSFWGDVGGGAGGALGSLGMLKMAGMFA